ncbi:MAG: hypothetical protein E7313_04915 [Clostridiales bacterium]|nr:hypothetical protein [Clostridiales bacterium]
MEILMKKNLKVNRILLIGICIYLIYIFISRQQTLNTYKKESQQYQDLIAKEQQYNAELLEKKENLNSTEYIEDVARNKLGMYLPNERVYIDISK